MIHLESLTLANTNIWTVNHVSLYLDAPSLRECNFRNIEASYMLDSDSEEEEGGHEIVELEFRERDDQITTLAITECGAQALEHFCRSLNMPSLTSLTIAFDERDTIAYGFLCLRDLVSLPACTRFNSSL